MADDDFADRLLEAIPGMPKRSEGPTNRIVEGAVARVSGKSKDDNPYPPGTLKWKQWQDGWDGHMPSHSRRRSEKKGMAKYRKQRGMLRKQ